MNSQSSAPKVTRLKIWSDPDRCGGCRHCGMDMDMDPYCVHPTVVANHPIGLNISRALEKYCAVIDTERPDEEEKLRLWEKRETSR